VTIAPQLSEELHAVAVVVADDRADLADLILLGLLDGSWAEFEREFLMGAALERDHPELVCRADVRGAATSFRLERGLISAKDFTAWMDERRLVVDDVYRYLRRGLLRERGPATEVPASGPAAERLPDEWSAQLRVEAICSGFLRRLTDTMVTWLVAAHRAESQLAAADQERIQETLELARRQTLAGLGQLGAADLEHRLRRLISAQRSAAVMSEETAASDAVARRVSQHGLEWIRLDGSVFHGATEGPAREVKLLLDEGVPEAALAERSGLQWVRRSMLCEAFPAELVAAHASAVSGETIGPWPDGSGWSVMRVVEKLTPSGADPGLRERATNELMQEAVARDAAGRTERRYAD
jgi:hypothetical protein